jgi:hypothetical protein
MNNFIDSIIKNNCVYSLGLDGGLAMSLSNNFVDDEDEQMELFCFWSDSKNAQKHQKEEWQDYQLITLSLSEFLEDWCIGMSDENYIAGTDFDTQMTGNEEDPLELLISICTRLEEQKIELKLKKFKSVSEILSSAQKAIQYGES